MCRVRCFCRGLRRGLSPVATGPAVNLSAFCRGGEGVTQAEWPERGGPSARDPWAASSGPGSVWIAGC